MLMPLAVRKALGIENKKALLEIRVSLVDAKKEESENPLKAHAPEFLLASVETGRCNCMSQDDIKLASAINLSDDPATILLNATDLKVILSEVQRLKTEIEAIHATQKTYAIRTTNEIDELFERVELLEGKQKKSKIQEDRD